MEVWERGMRVPVIPANATGVIPANAGIQKPTSQFASYWAPAFAGATEGVIPANAAGVIPAKAGIQ